MKHLPLLWIFLAAILWGCEQTPSEPAVADMTPEELEAYARDIHERVITLDTHDDIRTSNFTEAVNYTQNLETQVNLPKMEAGGLDVAWFVVYTGQGDLTDEGYAAAYENAIDKFDAIHRLCETIAPDRIGLALNSDDVRRIAGEGKKVAMIGIENGYPVGEDLSRVEEFYNRGARYMSLAHNGHSQLCDSNTGERDSVWLHNGLSDLGKQVIAEMNRLGMMIDISHPSKEAIRQMIELSAAPVIASHSSARALCDHSRNLDDEQLEWIRENGGVVQAVAFRGYVDAEKSEQRRELINALRDSLVEATGFERMNRREVMELPEAERNAYMEKWEALNRQLEPIIAAQVDPVASDVDVADFVDHIDYLVEKLGIEHVGISSDFDGGGGVKGWDDASETFNVTLELVKRGYTEAQIAMLWSGNLLRVLDEVESVAQRIQKEGI